MTERISIGRGDFQAELLTLGASLYRLDVPGRTGSDNVVLGYRDLADNIAVPKHFGAIPGRFANRIGGARFMLDGVEHRLVANSGGNSLHSGPDGLGMQLWEVRERSEEAVTFRIVSPHGANGFPGTVTVEARYRMVADGIVLELRATADRATVVNLTHHAYFNLDGEDSGGTVHHHWLQVPASRFTPVGATLVPVGELAPVAGTPFDFRQPKPVGRDLELADPQLALGRGYDHNLVIDTPSGTARRVATAYSPTSGRVLDVWSSAPGLQVYSANYIGNLPPGTSGRVYPENGALCLEPQGFPDSPNHAHFPSARLDPGEEYRHDIAFRFRQADNVEQAFTA